MSIYETKKMEDIEVGEKVFWRGADREIVEKTRETNPTDNREYVLLSYYVGNPIFDFENAKRTICDFPYDELEVLTIATMYQAESSCTIFWKNLNRTGKVVAISADKKEALVRLNYTCYKGKPEEYTATRYFVMDNLTERENSRQGILRNYTLENLPKKWHHRILLTGW